MHRGAPEGGRLPILSISEIHSAIVSSPSFFMSTSGSRKIRFTSVSEMSRPSFREHSRYLHGYVRLYNSAPYPAHDVLEPCRDPGIIFPGHIRIGIV